MPSRAAQAWDILLPALVVVVVLTTSAVLLLVLVRQQQSSYRSYLAEQVFRRSALSSLFASCYMRCGVNILWPLSSVLCLYCCLCVQLLLMPTTPSRVLNNHRTSSVHYVVKERRAIMPLIGSLFHNLSTDRPNPKRVKELLELIPMESYVQNLIHRAVIRGEEAMARFEESLSPEQRKLVHQSLLTMRDGDETIYLPMLHSITGTPVFWERSLESPRTKITREAASKVYTMAGVHEARVWDPGRDVYLSAEMAPIYDGPTKPSDATPGEKHKRVVKGLVILSTLPAKVVEDVFARFPFLPLRLQITIPDRSVDQVPHKNNDIYIADMMFGEKNEPLAEEYTTLVRMKTPEVMTTFRFTPTRRHAREHIWFSNPAVIELPVVVALFGVAFVFLLVSLQRQRRRAEESTILMENALKSRNRFLSYLCHELRNPMNTTKGYLEWLRDTKLSSEQEEYVEGLEKGFKHMLRILNDTLDLGKLEAGKVSLEHVNFDLCDLFNTTLKQYQGEAAAKGVKLVVQAAENAPRMLCADATRLCQIVSNLVSNAIKATSTGTIWVFISTTDAAASDASVEEELWRSVLPLPEDAPTIRHGRLRPLPPAFDAEGREKGQAVLVLRVVDQGPGMSSETLNALFLPFSQPTPTVARTGAGLGLSFLKELVQLWNGDVTVQSTVGIGSIFTVRLPVYLQTPGSKGPSDTLSDCLEEGKLGTPSGLRVRVRRSASQLAAALAEVTSSNFARNLQVSFESPASPISELCYRTPPTSPAATVSPPLSPLSSCSAPSPATSVSRAEGQRETLSLSFPSSSSSSSVSFPSAASGSALASSLLAPVTTPFLAQSHDSATVETRTTAEGVGLRHRIASYADALTERTARWERKQPETTSLASSLIPGSHVGLTGHSMASTSSSALAHTPTADPAAVLTKASSRHLILVVDDCPMNIRVISRKLTKWGYSVLSASNGQEAVNVVQARADELSLVIMDIQMPVMDGLEATATLRRLGYKIPIVALTGSVTPGERQLCAQKGMNDFLMKPIDDTQLRGVLARFLSGD